MAQDTLSAPRQAIYPGLQLPTALAFLAMGSAETGLPTG